MTEQILDRAQVGAAVEEVGRVGVAQGVRRHRTTVDPSLFDPACKPPAHVGGREAAARTRQQERAGRRVGDDPWTASLQPRDRGKQRRFPDRNGAHLVAFAAHAERLAVDVEVADVEANELLGAQATAVGKLKERAITETEHARTARARAGRVEETAGVGGAQHARKVVAATWRAEPLGRARVDPAVLAERGVERTDRGHATGDGGRCEAALREAGDVAAQLDEGDGFRLEVARDRPLGEVVEICGVGTACAVRETATREVTVEECRRRRPRVARGGLAGSLGVVGAFYIHVKEGTIATFQQLVEAEVIEPYDDPELPWHKIDAPNDASTLWYAALRKQERGIYLGTLTFRHCDHHSLLLESGWEEVPVEEIGVDDD